KKVLELPIPKFDPKNPVHLDLARIGAGCTAKVEKWLTAGGPGSIRSIGKLRSMVRQTLRAELEEIDTLAKKILA
ncbi:MAG: hypothetical protein HYY29_02380, partial [Chloroflexi bacterium]|nr:hypothetical protein [Chloroflexota bacterium]